MTGRRHFQTKRTSLFGSENEDGLSNHIAHSDTTPRIIYIIVNFLEVMLDPQTKSSNYGDWWKPVQHSPVEKVYFFFSLFRSRIRVSTVDFAQQNIQLA